MKSIKITLICTSMLISTALFAMQESQVGKTCTKPEKFFATKQTVSSYQYPLGTKLTGEIELKSGKKIAIAKLSTPYVGCQGVINISDTHYNVERTDQNTLTIVGIVG